MHDAGARLRLLLQPAALPLLHRRCVRVAVWEHDGRSRCRMHELGWGCMSWRTRRRLAAAAGAPVRPLFSVPCVHWWARTIQP